MGGVGSGNWYRFDKKTTTGECHGVDVRYLHRNGLLKAGGWFSLRWSRGEHETGSIGGSVEGHLRSRPERVILRYRSRSGQGSEWEDVWEPVSLTWTACNFGGERPWFLCPGTGCGRRVAVLYGPGRYFLCRHCYDLVYESQRENGDEPGPSQGASHTGASRREREHDEALPGEAQGDAPGDLRAALGGAPRG